MSAKPFWQDPTSLAVATAFLAGLSVPVSTALLNLSVVLLVLVTLMVPATRQQLSSALRQPLVQGCLVFFGAFAVGLLWTPDPSGAGLSMVGKMRAYAFAPLIFAACSLLPVRRGLLWGFAAGALLSALLSVGMALAKHPVGSGAVGDWSAFHTHTYHNTFLGFLVCAIGALWLSHRLPERWRYVSIAVTLICLASLFFLVRGRTAQIIVLLQLAVLLMMWRGRQGALFAIVGTVLLIPALYFSSHVLREGIATARADVVQLQQGNVDTSIGARVYYWENAVTLIRQAPLLGHGTGSYEKVFRQLTGHSEGDLGRANPHNDYLWVTAELGLFGLVCLLGMLATGVLQATRLPIPERWLGLLLLLGYAASTLTNSFFTDNITGAGFVLLACASMAGPWVTRSSGGSPA